MTSSGSQSGSPVRAGILIPRWRGSRLIGRQCGRVYFSLKATISSIRVQARAMRTIVRSRKQTDPLPPMPRGPPRDTGRRIGRPESCSRGLVGGPRRAGAGAEMPDLIEVARELGTCDLGAPLSSSPSMVRSTNGFTFPHCDRMAGPEESW